MFAENIILSKIKSLTPIGTIREVSELHWLALSQIVPEAKTLQELKSQVRSKPWEIIIYGNPENWGKNEIMTQIEATGTGSLARIIIKRRTTNEPQKDHFQGPPKVKE